jgi:hypothetical protein
LRVDPNAGTLTILDNDSSQVDQATGLTFATSTNYTMKFSRNGTAVTGSMVGGSVNASVSGTSSVNPSVAAHGVKNRRGEFRLNDLIFRTPL